MLRWRGMVTFRASGCQLPRTAFTETDAGFTVVQAVLRVRRLFPKPPALLEPTQSAVPDTQSREWTAQATRAFLAGAVAKFLGEAFGADLEYRGLPPANGVPGDQFWSVPVMSTDRITLIE